MKILPLLFLLPFFCCKATAQTEDGVKPGEYEVEGIWWSEFGRPSYIKITKSEGKLQTQYLLPPKAPISPEEVEPRTWIDENWSSTPKKYVQNVQDLNVFDSNRNFWKFTSANSAERHTRSSRPNITVLPTVYKRLRGLNTPTYEVSGTWMPVAPQPSEKAPRFLITSKLTDGVELILIDKAYRQKGKPIIFTASTNNTYLGAMEGQAENSSSVEFLPDNQVAVKLAGHPEITGADLYSYTYDRNDKLAEISLRRDTTRLLDTVRFFTFSNQKPTEITEKSEILKRLGRPIPVVGEANRNEDWYHVYMEPQKAYRFAVKGLKEPGIWPISAKIGFTNNGRSGPVSTIVSWSYNMSEDTQPTVLKEGTFSPPYAGYFWVVVSTQNAGEAGLYEFSYIDYAPSEWPEFRIENWGFEKGLLGWSTTGTAFDNQPTWGDNIVSQRALKKGQYEGIDPDSPDQPFAAPLGGDYWRDMAYPIGHKGNYWIGTFENRPSLQSESGITQGDLATGVLISPEFEITKDLCEFLIGGRSSSYDSKNIRVELHILPGEANQLASVPFIIYPSGISEQMHLESFDLSEFKNKGITAKIVIVDDAIHGHINVDDFRFIDTNENPEYLLIEDPRKSNGSYKLNKDAPVWGFADTHAHPASHLGFGGNLMVGDPNLSLDKTYSTDSCTAHHSEFGFSLTNNTFIGLADAHPMDGGYPHFTGYPRFTSKTHQQQHVEFLHRAWQGGLRLYCALAVNNMFLPTLGIGPGNDGQALDDESVMYRQLEYIKTLVSTNSSWMEIALKPSDARRIIHQGKLAIVLGVEADNFGNFKDDNYIWKDNTDRDEPLVSLNEDNADELLSQKIDGYYDLGIRQITPIHYISGVFGGAAVFQAKTALVQFGFLGNLTIKSGYDQGVAYSLFTDFMDATNFLSALISGQVTSQLILMDSLAQTSTISAEGLAPIGEKLITKMMQGGMLIDSDHMSYESKGDVFELANHAGYPIMSSHTDPGALSFVRLTPEKDTLSFGTSDEDNFKNFGTSVIGNVKHEAQVFDSHITQIQQSGGIVSPLLLPYRRNSYTGKLGKIDNDCAGSSKTWAQMYLHSVDKMKGKGIALSSDRGMVDFIAPRFGVNAAFNMKDEKLDKLKNTKRTTQRHAQTNGVKYAEPFSIYHPILFEGGDVEGKEEDAWKALAAWKAATQGGAKDPRESGEFNGRTLNYLKGLYAERETDLSTWTVVAGETPWEQAAMFCLKTGTLPATLTIHDEGGIENTQRYYDELLPVWKLWNALAGDNIPLKRCVSGMPNQTKAWKLRPSDEEDGIKHRDWDYNLDGLAHYGLIPDFIQDLRNIGMTPAQLTPLFRSAEDYIQMWEKAEKAKESLQLQD